MSRICIITPNYPEPRFIERGVFIERLAGEWERHGLEVNVVAPRSLALHFRSLFRSPNRRTLAGRSILRPLYLSASNKNIGLVHLQDVTRRHFINAAKRAVRKLPVPDLYYGQFLMNGGRAALQAGKMNRRPVFADVGESSLTGSMSPWESEAAEEIIRSFTGLISVSSKLKDQLVALGADPDRVLVAPNNIDLKRFHPMDRKDCRERLNLQKDDFIISFVGHFIERKGPLRVLKALEDLEGKVKGVFLGRGPQRPAGPRVLRSGPVPNADLPLWLNASDLFVLPTRSEGHCNAINEAMACGIPVVTSDIPEVRSQVPDQAGILVDPCDSSRIAESIRFLMDHPDKRKTLGANARKIQLRRNTRSRGRVIHDWMKEMVRLR